MAAREGEVADEAQGADEAPFGAPPAVILAEPQLGENIGAAARAMANFGLSDLRLVAPRDGWPNEKARAAASGADHVLDRARVFTNLSDALADLTFVIATTRRPRDMTKRVLGPADGLSEAVDAARAGGASGILFGRERWGLENDEVAKASVIVSFPVDARFASLNLAQSVLLMAYEWRRMAHTPPQVETPQASATRGEVEALWQHLVRVLEPTGYFRPDQMASKMRRNLMLILTDAVWNSQQVRTLRGVLAHLERNKPFS